jgi:hypothetical protein
MSCFTSRADRNPVPYTHPRRTSRRTCRARSTNILEACRAKSRRPRHRDNRRAKSTATARYTPIENEAQHTRFQKAPVAVRGDKDRQPTSSPSRTSVAFVLPVRDAGGVRSTRTVQRQSARAVMPTVLHSALRRRGGDPASRRISRRSDDLTTSRGQRPARSCSGGAERPQPGSEGQVVQIRTGWRSSVREIAERCVRAARQHSSIPLVVSVQERTSDRKGKSEVISSPALRPDQHGDSAPGLGTSRQHSLDEGLRRTAGCRLSRRQASTITVPRQRHMIEPNETNGNGMRSRPGPASGHYLVAGGKGRTPPVHRRASPRTKPLRPV